MAVITISRELGSEGNRIANLLCEELGHCRLDTDMLMAIAREAGVDVDAVLAKEREVLRRPKLISADMTALYEKDPSAFVEEAEMDDRTYNRVVRETMEKYAREGDTVIVSRGGQMVLRDWPAAVHVHLYANPEVRVRRLVERMDISEAEAKQLIEQSDQRKREYIRRVHGNANWKDLRYYRLAIDTSLISPETAAQMIMLAARDGQVAQE
jgi:cytidylate kinase